MDIVNNSYGSDSINFSEEIFTALRVSLEWNYSNIYSNPIKMKQDHKIVKMFNTVLDSCLYSLDKNMADEYIWIWANKTMKKEYREINSYERIVADFISGMTDDFLITTYKNLLLPKSFGYTFKRDSN